MSVPTAIVSEKVGFAPENGAAPDAPEDEPPARQGPRNDVSAEPADEAFAPLVARPSAPDPRNGP